MPHELLPWPPCGNPRKTGHCGVCSYCQRRLYGPDWWRYPQAFWEALVKERGWAQRRGRVT